MLRVEIGGGCKQSTWVLLCRLEHIAAIGKRFGDAVLNRMVRAVTGGLRRTCRKQDAVARSGDNFILTLRDLEAPLVESKKITVAALVEGISLAHLGDRLVPVLAGAAHAPHEASEPEQLLALAAQRLRPVDIPAASFAENLVHLAAAIETGVRLPEDFSEPEPEPALVRVALQPVQIHAPLAGETQE
jgi:GGDEF domain-containing protein